MEIQPQNPLHPSFLSSSCISLPNTSLFYLNRHWHKLQLLNADNKVCHLIAGKNMCNGKSVENGKNASDGIYFADCSISALRMQLCSSSRCHFSAIVICNSDVNGPVSAYVCVSSERLCHEHGSQQTRSKAKKIFWELVAHNLNHGPCLNKVTIQFTKEKSKSYKNVTVKSNLHALTVNFSQLLCLFKRPPANRAIPSYFLCRQPCHAISALPSTATREKAWIAMEEEEKREETPRTSERVCEAACYAC